MIRKLLCKLGIHKCELEIVKNNSDGTEYGIFYDYHSKELKGMIAINERCKHCGKPLGSHLVTSHILAKHLGLEEIKR